MPINALWCSNMASPKRYGERVSTAVRFEPDLIQRLRAVADDRDVSLNLLVNRAVSHWLGEYGPALDARRDPDVRAAKQVSPRYKKDVK
jgi:hypothetical protein